MSPLVTLPHILLVLAGAFLVGVRAFHETQPKGAQPDEDSLQLHRFANYAGIGFVLLMLAIVLGLDLNFFHVAKAMQ